MAITLLISSAESVPAHQENCAIAIQDPASKIRHNGLKECTIWVKASLELPWNPPPHYPLWTHYPLWKQYL